MPADNNTDTNQRQPMPTAMASAAHRVFAVAELFDQIMLNKCISLERLFILQRVNKCFQANISSSFYLQGKMRLRYRTDAEEMDHDPDDLHTALHPLLHGRRGLELRPFEFKDYSFIEDLSFIGKHSAGHAQVTMELVLYADMLETAESFGTKLGLHGRKSMHGCDESWGQMVISSIQMRMWIRVTTHYAHDDRCHIHTRVGKDETIIMDGIGPAMRKKKEWMALQAPQASDDLVTLRDLFHAIEQAIKTETRVTEQLKEARARVTEQAERAEASS